MNDENEVQVMIYDLTQPETEGVEPGFYYDIPEDPDNQETDEIRLAGPYPTGEAAIAAAQEFIDWALSEFLAESEEENIEFLDPDDEIKSTEA